MNQALLYTVCVIVGLWGVAHLFATRGVVAGFGELTADNRQIITMEWIVEGVALIATATFAAVTTAIQPEAVLASAIYAVAILTLVVLAIVSLFTGFKIAFLPFRLYPFVDRAVLAFADQRGTAGASLSSCRPRIDLGFRCNSTLADQRQSNRSEVRYRL